MPLTRLPLTRLALTKLALTRLAVTVLALTVLAAGCSAGPAAPGPKAASAPSTLNGYYAQRLDWRPCDNGFECARLLVPFDYARPGGGGSRCR